MSEKNINEMKEYGCLELEGNKKKHHIKLITIIGEIEGHEAVSGNAKATKYEHLLPILPKSCPRPQYLLQKCLFPQKIANPKGTRKSIIPSHANKILKNPSVK